MKAIDFFCGAGGLTKGLSQAGIDVIAGIDIDPRCGLTYKNNNSSDFWETDIAEISSQDIFERYPVLSNKNETVLFAACAPCQPFSMQRRIKRNTSDRLLLLHFGRIVSECKPHWVLIENVPGITNKNNNTPIYEFINMLRESNYELIYDVLNSKDYGVAQNRRRYILIASLKGEVSLPLKTHGPKLHGYKTVRDAISHFPPISAGQTHPTIKNHVSSSLSEINLTRIKHTPHNGGDRRSWPNSLILDCHKSHKGHTDVYGRMYWDRPAPTLTGKCISLSNGRYGHPEQNRAISLREAATLQGYPEDYEFFGPLQSMALQIGNSVPVQLAKVLGKHILELDNKIS